MISVVLPVVKTEYFEEALQSILRQTYRDFELVVVDNQADDGFQEIINRNLDTRIRVINHRERVPIIDNWNRCLSYAKFDYFILFSDDDLMDPNYLSEMVQLAVRYPEIKMFHSRVRLFENSGKTRKFSPIGPEVEEGINYVYETFVHNRTQLISDFMWNREFFIAQSGYEKLEGAWGSDEVTTYKMAMASGVVGYSSRALVHWRFSLENFTNTMRYKVQLAATQDFSKWMKRFLLELDQNDLSDERLTLIKREFPKILMKRYSACLQNMAMSQSFLSPFILKMFNRKFAKLVNWESVVSASVISLAKKFKGIRSHRA